MADQMAAILAEPLDEAEPMNPHEGMNQPEQVFTCTWAQLEKQHPQSFMEIQGSMLSIGMVRILKCFHLVLV
jgi:hypothetical protein